MLAERWSVLRRNGRDGLRSRSWPARRDLSGAPESAGTATTDPGVRISPQSALAVSTAYTAVLAHGTRNTIRSFRGCCIREGDRNQPQQMTNHRKIKETKSVRILAHAHTHMKCRMIWMDNTPDQWFLCYSGNCYGSTVKRLHWCGAIDMGYVLKTLTMRYQQLKIWRFCNKFPKFIW